MASTIEPMKQHSRLHRPSRVVERAAWCSEPAILGRCGSPGALCSMPILCRDTGEWSPFSGHPALSFACHSGCQEVGPHDGRRSPLLVLDMMHYMH
nr:hypothetical protein CFP56_11469 [Quercus suber]